MFVPGTTPPATAPVAPSSAPTSNDPVVFAPGTGNGVTPGGLAPPPAPVYVAPPRASISCADINRIETTLAQAYRAGAVQLASFESETVDHDALLPKSRLDRELFESAFASYRQHVCQFGGASGPANIIIVDFAKKSNEPRLYNIDLRTGQGIDDPVLVAHGKGSDPDRDGYADVFSNVKDSLMSSLGAVRGAEIYQGRNGRSLRLDGLDQTNNQVRYRDIVVHSYRGSGRVYFNAAYQGDRLIQPGMSEGCFVVEPNRRDWLIDTLADRGFLYAGLSGERGKQIMAAMERANQPPTLPPGSEVVFVSGTGAPGTP